MIGDRISRAIEETPGMDVATLASRLDPPVAPQSVYRWMRGEHEPTVKTLRQLARLTNKPLYFFISDRSAPGSSRYGSVRVTIDGTEVFRTSFSSNSDIAVAIDRE